MISKYASNEVVGNGFFADMQQALENNGADSTQYTAITNNLSDAIENRDIDISAVIAELAKCAEILEEAKSPSVAKVDEVLQFVDAHLKSKVK